MITKELQSTVASNSHIENVHYDANGGYYFDAHKCEKSGELFGRLTESYEIKGKDGIEISPVKKMKGVESTKIVKTIPRKTILKWNENSKPASDPLVDETTKK